MSFDGFENYIQINNISNYNFDSFTLGCWFKQDAAANGFEMIMGKDCPGCENINGDWGVFVDNGTVRFFAQNTLSFNWGNVCNYSGISDENWHFIVATRNGSTGLLRLFIDGVEVDSKIDFTGLINNIEPVFIGKYYAGASDFTTSFYSDNFMMWNTELTGQEIQQYMDCPPVGDEQGLVGYWNFEEGQETIAYDQTANANNGTIHGATYDTSVPVQSCGLTNINGCDSTAVLNLTLLPCSGEEVSTFCGEGTVWDADAQECIVAIPTDTNFDGCTDLNDLLDILSAYGDCSVPAFNCGDDIEHEDYVYSSVQIGEQCWFAENCRYLPVVSSPLLGSEEGGLAYAYVYNYYGDDIEAAKLENSYIKSGALYNVQAIESWVLCPNHWHAAHESDWLALEEEIGIEIDQLEILGWRGSTEGYNLKVNDCDGSWNGSNIYGFSARGHGTRSDLEKDFIDYCIDGNYHTLTNGTAEYYRRAITSYQNGIYRDNASIHAGMGVRCIKD